MAIKKNKTEYMNSHRQISIHGHTYYNMKCTAEVYFVNAQKMSPIKLILVITSRKGRK